MVNFGRRLPRLPGQNCTPVYINAPFVPELSRASVKDTPANEVLFTQLASLARKSLHVVKARGLLTAGFLEVLPNPQDALSDRYEPIRSAIVEEMNEQPLTPVYGGEGHAPAKQLLQSRATLKALLSEADIEYLVEYDDAPPRWAIGATQKNSDIDRFLSSLAIREWDVDDLVDILSRKAGGQYSFDPSTNSYMRRPESEFLAWLDSKTSEWHQLFYATLYRELEPDGGLLQLNDLHIVRLTDGRYGEGKNSYFPGADGDADDVLQRVDRDVYTSGKSKPQQTAARALLEVIGVREVGETDEVQALLQRRYSAIAEPPTDKTYLSDLKRFVDLVEAEPSCASLFKEAYIFETATDYWTTPGKVYLDAPYRSTGLEEFYQTVSGESEKQILSARYHRCGIPEDRFIRFAEAVGVQTSLKPRLVRVADNPEAAYLYAVSGEKNRSPINRDYIIEGLERLLKTPTLPIARLVWRTMSELPAKPYLTAVFQRNERGGARFAASQLVHLLRRQSWVPQSEGRFVQPRAARRELLPESGFPFDAGQEWLKAVQFGEQVEAESEGEKRRRAVAKELLGSDDIELLRDAQWFVGLSAGEKQLLRGEVERRRAIEIPDPTSKNPVLRKQRAGEAAKGAPDRLTEVRQRSVAIGLSAVKGEAEQFLRDQYTNFDGVMICQICQKEMPFKLANGQYYFEKVQLLPSLQKHHRQNYLALCPNDAARFQYVNESGDELTGILKAAEREAVRLRLAGEEHAIYFTEPHFLEVLGMLGDESSQDSDD